MKKQIQRFSVYQTSKVFGLTYLMGSAVVIIPFTILGVIFGGKEVLVWLLMPLVYWLASFLAVALFCFFYNLAAKYVGGIEFRLSNVNEAPVLISEDSDEDEDEDEDQDHKPTT